MEKLFILISFELPYFCFDTPLRFRPLLKREGIYRKKLDVITFPLSSSSRGYRRFNGRTTSSKQKALVCPKTEKQLQKYYIRDVVKWKCHIRAGQLFQLILYFPQAHNQGLPCRSEIASESQKNLIIGVLGSILSHHQIAGEIDFL